MKDKRPTLTTTAGNPVGDAQNSLTAGPRGPVLLQDYQLIEKLAHQNRERIPERTVHAKGWGAHGTFTVTNDITKYTKAKVFEQIGKKTDMIARFSTVAGELGAGVAAGGQDPPLESVAALVPETHITAGAEPVTGGPARLPGKGWPAAPAAA